MRTKLCMALAAGALLELPGGGAAAADIVDFSEIADLDAAAQAIPEWREKIPVLRGDSIWSIARKYCPQGVTQDQMALALYFSNPDAFAGHNINRLNTGIWLNLPPSVLFTQVSQTDAKELLDKLRSDSAYDAQTLLRRLKKSESAATESAKPSSETLAVKLPPVTLLPSAAAPSPDAGKPTLDTAAAQPPSPAPQPLPSSAEKDSMQPPPTRLNLEPVTLPAAALPPSHQATAKEPPAPAIEPPELSDANHPVSSQPDTAATTAATAPAPTPAAEESPAATDDQSVPCVTESCRMAMDMDMKNRLIAIQSELSLLNANLAASKQTPPATENKTSADSGEQPGKDTAAGSKGDVLLQTWHSIKALNPIAFGSIALAGAMFQLALSVLIKLMLPSRKIAAVPAPSPAVVTKAAPTPESTQNYRTEPPPFKAYPEDLLKKFEPVILAEVDEIDELPLIATKPKTTAAAPAAPAKKRIEKNDDVIDLLGGRSSGSRKPKTAATQETKNYSRPKASKASASKTAVLSKTPRPSEPEQITDASEYGKDDLSLDFGLQDGKLHH